jgi:hypothetical protein
VATSETGAVPAQRIENANPLPRELPILSHGAQTIVAISTHHLLKGRLGRGHGATALLIDIGNVRFTPASDQRADIAECLKGANRRPQSITSALTRIDGGIVTPSALAVFKLMAKSKRIGP